MATPNKKKLATLNKENCEEHHRSSLAQNLNVPRSQENYITQVFKEIEGRVTKKLSQEVSRTKPHTRRTSAACRLLHDTANSGPLQNRSGDVPERK